MMYLGSIARILFLEMLSSLGIAGAFVATYLGQAIGWYQAGQSAGFIGATVGAIIVLVVWGFFAPRRAIPRATRRIAEREIREQKARHADILDDIFGAAHDNGGDIVLFQHSRG